MHIKYFIEKEYKKITRLVRNKSRVLYVNENDLMSIVNEKLSVAANTDKYFFDHENQFFGFLTVVINNCAFDLKRKIVPMTDIDEVKEDYEKTIVVQPESELKALFNLVCAEFANSKRSNFKEVFDAYFMADLSYLEICEKLKLTMPDVKSRIFQIRKQANKLYSQQYQELIA